MVFGDGANGVEDFFAASVGEADREHEAVVPCRASFGVIDGLDDPRRQEVTATDDLNANVVCMDAWVLRDVVEPLDVQVKEGIQLFLRPVEVLRGQGIDGEPRDVQFEDPVQDLLELGLANAVADT